jgi:DNA-binding response OmpR family regulator
MPEMDGLYFAAQIRKEDGKTPIIITTAHTDTNYLLCAVELQLITYIIKPITTTKLHEALDMACKSIKEHTPPHIQLTPTTHYDVLNQTLLSDGVAIKLTHNELRFFDFLVTHRERAITYSEIESLIWAYEGMSMDALRSLVRGLRQKLGDITIENISRIGYRLIIVPN